MATLKIDYLEEEQSALLTLTDAGAVWSKIKRVCNDHSDDVEINSNTLTLPWWSFLGAKDDIYYYANKFGLRVEPTGIASVFLEKAKSSESQYVQAENVSFESEKDIKDKLREKNFIRNLKDEQIRNLKLLLKYSAAATFSVPGAGKTTEALAYYILKKTQYSKLLVVCPKNVFAAWEEQISECVPNSTFKISRLVGGKRIISGILKNDPDIMLITYQQFPNVIDVIAKYLLEHEVFMFLDESHRIKRGLSGVIGQSLLGVSHLPISKLIMSGTPMPNSVDDLLPQFNFLYPEIEADTENVKELFRPVYVRTTKSELGLPKPKRILVPVQMNEKQSYLYYLLCSEIARQSDVRLNANDRIRLRAIGKSVMRLLQLASNPALLIKTDLGQNDVYAEVLDEGDSPKLQFAMKRARQLAKQGKKCIIWSSFVDNVELIAERLTDLKAEYIHGGVEAGSEEEEDTRESKIRKFHDDDNCYVLVANPAACSEGISLHTVCQNAIYIDRNYNAAQYIQSEDRIHRLGLEKDADIHVEILIAKNSIDEAVNNRLLQKISKMAEFLDDKDLDISSNMFDLDDTSLDFADIESALSHVKNYILNTYV